MRVSTPPSQGIGITIGFMVDAKAYIKFQETFGFPVAADNAVFIHCDDKEYYRVRDILDNYKDCQEFLAY